MESKRVKADEGLEEIGWQYLTIHSQWSMTAQTKARECLELPYFLKSTSSANCKISSLPGHLSFPL